MRWIKKHKLISFLLTVIVVSLIVLVVSVSMGSGGNAVIFQVIEVMKQQFLRQHIRRRRKTSQQSVRRYFGQYLRDLFL